MGNSLTNNGLISSDGGGNLYIQADKFTNSATGTLAASNGGNLYLQSSTTVLNGTFNIGANSAIYLNSSVDNGGTAFTVTSGALTLNDGTLSNAIVNGGPGTGLATAAGTSNTLNNVTVNADLNLNGYNSITFIPNALAVSGTLSVGGNGSVAGLVFNNPTANSTTGIANIVLGGTTYTGYYGNLEQTNGNTLTIASGTTMHGANGSIGQLYSGASDTLINNGTINADVSGGSLNINATNFSNTGTLSASNGGTLNLQSGSIVLNGIVSIGTGSAIYLNGTVDNGGSAFTITSGALTLNNGTLKNAVINISGMGTGLAIASTTNTNTLGNVTINGSTACSIDFDAQTNTTLTLAAGTTLAGTIGLIGGSYDGVGSGVSMLINNGNLINNVNGNILTIATGIFINNGTLSAENGSTIYVTDQWTNNGSLSTSSGGAIILTGTLSGTVTDSSLLQVQGGTLTNATLDGGVNITGGDAYVGPNVTFGSASPILIDNFNTLSFVASNPNLNSELIFGSNDGFVTFDNTTLTLGAQALVHGANGFIGDGNNDALINNGTIDADVNGGNIYILANNFTNNGILKAENGGTLYFQPTNWTNTGTLVTNTGGTIYLGGTLNNTGSTFDALNTVTGTNNAILMGTISGGNLVNSSSLQIQGGILTNVTLDGGLTQTNGAAADISDGVTFGTATPTTIDNGSTIAFTGINAPTFNTELIFGTNGGNLLFDNLTLTLGNNALVHGANGVIGDGNNDTLVNNGTIIADVSGGILALNSANFINNGTLTAQEGALALNSTTTLAGGTFTVVSGGTVAANGMITQTGGTTQVDGSLLTAAVWQLQGGLITGTGTITGDIKASDNQRCCWRIQISRR